MKLQERKKITSYDILAAAVCAVMFGYFFFAIRFGFRVPDESFYLAVAQRFAKGDRPLVDEWQLSQLSELFLVPLYRLFKALTGGTEGIILFMRQVFLLVNFACYWFFYQKLRDYRLGAVIAVAVFCGYVPSAVFALNYYTMTLRLLLVFCLVLFYHPGKTPSVRRLLLAGVLLSAAVLNEPPLAMLYVLYSVSVLAAACVKKKRPSFGKTFAFLLNGRHWGWLSLSVAVCACAFLVYLGAKSGFKNILAALPELLSDSEYDFSADGNVRGFLLSKLEYAGNLFGRVNLALSALLCAAVLWFRTIKRREKGKEVFFLLSLLLLVSCCVYPVLAQALYVPGGLGGTFHLTYYVSTPLPLYTFGLVNYLLCRRRDPRLFLLWLVGALASLCMDTFSDISFGNCAILCVFPAVFCFGELMREHAERKTAICDPAGKGRNEKKKTARNRERTLGLVCVAAFGVFVLWEGANVFFEGRALFAEQIVRVKQNQPMTMTKTQRGPHKGIYTVGAIRQSYDELLEDLDILKAKTDGPVYIDPPDAAAFLYLDLPSANCSTWNSKSPRSRQVRYFASHPEKLPAAMYWIKKDSLCLWKYSPKQMQTLLELSRLLCDGEETAANRGRIVRVRQWKDFFDPSLAQWFETHDTGF